MLKLLVLLTGCSGVSLPSTTDLGAGTSAAAPVAQQVTIAVNGPQDALPTEIAIHSRQPLFAEVPADGRPPADVVLSLNPPVEGEWRAVDRWTLVFTPANSFAPETTYTASIQALPGQSDPVGNAGPVWTQTFTTPAFRFLRASLRGWNQKKQRIEVDLMFSGPVNERDVMSQTRFTLDGMGLTPIAVSAAGVPYTVRATLSDPQFGKAEAVKSRLDVSLSAVTMAGATAKSQSARASLPIDNTAPLVSLREVVVKEGTSGHYLQVYCQDSAVDEGRWWWDEETWEGYEVSSRCQFDEASLREALHISPAVDYTIAPGYGGFRIFGPFGFGDYEVRIDGGARTVDGGVTNTTYTASLNVPHRTPKVRFASNGRYLPKKAWQNLAIRHINAPKVKLNVRHVPPENLVFWMSSGEDAEERNSNLILEKTLSLPVPMDSEATSYLDLSTMVPDPAPGVYELELVQENEVKADEDPDTGYHDPYDRSDPLYGSARAAVRLMRTDLHLLAKMASKGPQDQYTPEVMAWVLDVHTNQPVSGAEVKLVRESGFALGRCQTGPDGSCTIAVPQNDPDPSQPFALIASKSGDLTYIRFADLMIEPTGDVAGAPYLEEQPYRAGLYTDRGVYRPGETVHVAGVVRDRDHVAPTDAVPVVLKLYDPQGKLLREKVVSTNSGGMVSLDLPFGDYATTGRYRVGAEVAKRLVGEARFAIEEFVPERMRATAKMDGAFRPGDAIPVGVEAAWLFGGSANGSRVELSCQVEASTFTPKNNADYHYGPATLQNEKPARPLLLGMVEDTLNTNGRADLQCPPSDRAATFTGPAKVIAKASVFEGDSGRTTLAEASAPVHPERFYIGLKTGTKKTEAGRPFKVEGVLADWDGNVQNTASDVAIELIRLDEQSFWTWDEDNGTSNWQRLLRRAPEGRLSVPVQGGRFSVELTPQQQAAGYLVVASSGKTKTELYVPGPGRWWWSSFDGAVDQTPQPEAPTSLVVSLPEAAKVGDSVPVKVMAPYAGRMLLTVETHEVLKTAWLDVQPGEVTWSFPVTDFTPNVYVSALLIKDPHLESADAFLPDRAFGVAPLSITPTAFTQAVKLSAPAEIRPDSTLAVDVDLGPLAEPTFVTMAAVDEGILSLTRFADPNPMKDIFARRALGVSTFETVGWTLLFTPAGPAGQTGGDATGGIGRVQMVKPVSLWSGVVEVPTSGKTTVRFAVPRYRGELRVMAVASSKTRIGSASTKVRVTEPLVLQTTAPRFLITNDVAQVPVHLSNQSGANQVVKVRMDVEDLSLSEQKWMVDVGGAPVVPLTVTGQQELTVELAKDASTTVVFPVKGKASPGAARLRVTASAGKLSSKEDLDVPIIAAQPEDRVVTRLPLKAGSNDLAIPFTGWLDGSDKATVWVTTNPYAPALSHLRHLIRYPYGCIEQTTSSTRPLLYVSNLVDRLDPKLTDGGKLAEMVQHGLDRVLSMQTPSGGFSYWPGDQSPVVWGSVYAGQLLLDARDKGYPVPNDSIDDLLGYLERVVDKQENPNETAYAHYLLARAGRGRPAQAETFLRGLSRDARAETLYTLKAAMYLAGDRRYEKDLRAPDSTPIQRARAQNDWSFWSALRERGMMLSTFRDLFSKDPAGSALTEVVASELMRNKSAWYTTQELAWGITGLGKSVDTSAKPASPPSLKVGGKALTSKGEEPSWNLYRAASSTSLSLEVPDNAGGNLYAVVTVEGVRATYDLPAGGSGLALTREYLDSSGTPINSVELGDVVFVRLKLRNDTGRNLSHIALVDRVPSSWEIENPRLGRGVVPDWLEADALWEIDHMNVRDDRIEAFGDLEPSAEVQVVYLVRAVTAGTFTIPEVYAEAMYDPDFWARAYGGPLSVQGPWGL